MIDSENVRWGVLNSDKGIDGHKRIKGIKRHIAVDEDGLQLSIHVTKANLHDSKGAVPLINRPWFIGTRRMLRNVRRLFGSFLPSFQSQPKGCSFKDGRKYPKNPPPWHQEILVDGALDFDSGRLEHPAVIIGFLFELKRVSATGGG